MRQLLLSLAFMGSAWLSVQAQTPLAKANRQVIPPSPTAASLGIYGEVGVGYFTGLPDINVPLYEVKERSISLPISLRYNASGTRVAENASWVGLGWSLAAGGVITRTVRGLDDFKDNGDAGTGYYNASALPAVLNYMPPESKPTTSYDKLYFKGILSGATDAEPDIFTYNFGAYSGKFVLGKRRDGSLALVDEQNNLQIICSPNRWLITDARGYQYLFADEEITSTYSYSSPSTEAPNDIALRDLTYQPDKASVTTAWYLSSITAPTGETVRFTYGRGESLSLLNKSEDEYTLLETQGGCIGNYSASSRMKGRYATYSASKQVITDRYLQKITFSHGTIEFATSPREDVEYRDPDPARHPAKLATLLVKDTAGVVVRSFRFSYGYFGTDGLQRRLRLDSLTERGQGSARKPPYVFSYYPGGSVFNDKYSKSIDHWGYYNGKTNARLLPQMLVADYTRYLEGADREPEQTEVYPKQGVLQTITYPTGGRTVFDYELHDYGNTKNQLRAVPHFVFVNARPDKSLEREEEFTLADTTVVTASYGFTEVNCAADGCQLRSQNIGLFFIERLSAPAGSPLIVNNTPAPTSPTPSPDDTPYRTHEEGQRTLVLLPGRYRARVWYVPGYSTSLSVSWTDYVQDSTITQRRGGGLRVKSITNYDGTRLVKQRTFKYTMKVGSKEVSSGVQLDQPVYSLRVSQPESKVTFNKADDSPSGQCDYTGFYIGRFSSLVHPFGLSARGTIGYQQVTESLGEQGEGGRTEYTFFCKPDQLPPFPTVPAQGYPLNGRLLQRLTYAASGELLEEESSTYEVKNGGGQYGVKVFVSPAEQDASWSADNGSSYTQNTGDVEGRFFSYAYLNLSTWVTLASQTQTSYHGGQAFTSTKTFAYENAAHKEITREQVTASSGGTRVTYHLYPADYPTTTGFVGQLKAAHITSVPLEQVNCQMAAPGAPPTVVGALLTTYSPVGLAEGQWQWVAAQPVPLSDFKFTNQAQAGRLPTSGSTVDFTLAGKDARYPALPDVRLGYDAYGQLQQTKRRSGLATVYLWGYAHALPVAQIENASATQVQTALASLGWQPNALPLEEATLRRMCEQLRQRLPQARLTSLTYRPLFGLTSQTDPTGRTTNYEYDGLGRLVRTRDEQGRILSQQQYHYAGK